MGGLRSARFAKTYEMVIGVASDRTKVTIHCLLLRAIILRGVDEYRLAMAAPKMGRKDAPATCKRSSVSHCIMVATWEGNMNPGVFLKLRS